MGDQQMSVTEVFAGVRVRDREAAIEFYERLLGAPPTMLPNEDEAAWQLTDSGWLYVVCDAGKAGSGLVTLLVDDLDEQLAALAQRGVETGPVEEKAGGAVRSIWVVDPDGNRIQLGQPG
jgi:catechol 2,3-dioxygenase-like lactoylglutathione lyase family enzyme